MSKDRWNDPKYWYLGVSDFGSDQWSIFHVAAPDDENKRYLKAHETFREIWHLSKNGRVFPFGVSPHFYFNEEADRSHWIKGREKYSLTGQVTRNLEDAIFLVAGLKCGADEPR